MAEFGKALSYVAAFIILFLVIGSFLWVKYAPTILEAESEAPQCNDDIDNDNDSLIDFPDDPDCKDRGDDSERDWSTFWTVFGIILGLMFLGGVVYIIIKVTQKDEKGDEGFSKKPVDADRARELMLSWFLTHQADDIKALVKRQEKDGLLIYHKPENIREINIEIFYHSKTGEPLLNVEYQVVGSSWQGHHMLGTSLARGEEYIKKGNIWFEINEGLIKGSVWRPKQNTFPRSSPLDKNERMIGQIMDNMGDKSPTDMKELIGLLSTSKDSGGQFGLVHESDDDVTPSMQYPVNYTQNKTAPKRRRIAAQPSMNQQHYPNPNELN